MQKQSKWLGLVLIAGMVWGANCGGPSLFSQIGNDDGSGSVNSPVDLPEGTAIEGTVGGEAIQVPTSEVSTSVIGSYYYIEGAAADSEDFQFVISQSFGEGNADRVIMAADSDFMLQNEMLETGVPFSFYHAQGLGEVTLNGAESIFDSAIVEFTTLGTSSGEMVAGTVYLSSTQSSNELTFRFSGPFGSALQ